MTVEDMKLQCARHTVEQCWCEPDKLKRAEMMNDDQHGCVSLTIIFTFYHDMDGDEGIRKIWIVFITKFHPGSLLICTRAQFNESPSFIKRIFRIMLIHLSGSSSLPTQLGSPHAIGSVLSYI